MFLNCNSFTDKECENVGAFEWEQMSSPGTCEQVTGTLPVWVMIYYPLPIKSIFFSPLFSVSSLLSLKELQGKYQGRSHQEAKLLVCK